MFKGCYSAGNLAMPKLECDSQISKFMYMFQTPLDEVLCKIKRKYSGNKGLNLLLLSLDQL